MALFLNMKVKGRLRLDTAEGPVEIVLDRPRGRDYIRFSVTAPLSIKITRHEPEMNPPAPKGRRKPA